MNRIGIVVAICILAALVAFAWLHQRTMVAGLPPRTVCPTQIDALAQAAARHHLGYAVEGFADRRMRADGSLVPRSQPGPRLMAVNIDEGEPGTFKDRWILENAPHLLLESMLITAYALQVRHAFVYIRGEFDLPYRRLAGAIEVLTEIGADFFKRPKVARCF